jgi:hypothetical protein
MTGERLGGVGASGVGFELWEVGGGGGVPS